MSHFSHLSHPPQDPRQHHKLIGLFDSYGSIQYTSDSFTWDNFRKSRSQDNCMSIKRGRTEPDYSTQYVNRFGRTIEQQWMLFLCGRLSSRKFPGIFVVSAHALTKTKALYQAHSLQKRNSPCLVQAVNRNRVQLTFMISNVCRSASDSLIIFRALTRS